MADIFDEVNEDLRAERAQALLKRYGGVLLAAMLLVVAGAAAWQGWRWWRDKQEMALAGEFVAAMNRADGRNTAKPEAIAAFDQLAAKSPDGYATLARLRAAALKADAGDLAGAVALWDQVAADGSADPLLRDLASLTSVQHQVPTADPGTLGARLAPLASPDNPWHALAMEQQALLSIRMGRTAEATDTLRRIVADGTAPQGVRARANGLLERLGGSAA
ncbi:MAG: tetratricopeptide repeat protein [Acetobacteraceae bacterium]|nr:tetratricopeptide repeat protein [Acetobacteraceae bacterium]